MIVEILADDGTVFAEDDTRNNCQGGDDLCGGCFACQLRQYPDMRWRPKIAETENPNFTTHTDSIEEGRPNLEDDVFKIQLLAGEWS